MTLWNLNPLDVFFQLLQVINFQTGIGIPGVAMGAESSARALLSLSPKTLASFVGRR